MTNQTRPNASEWFRLEERCTANYNVLLDQVHSSKDVGTAQCPTPIKRAALDSLMKWMTDQGWGPRYEITVSRDYHGRVRLCWDATKQWTSMVIVQSIDVKALEMMEPLVYHEQELIRHTAAGTKGKN